jgi:uncharacterized protein YndB with AHSA1/START domain
VLVRIREEVQEVPRSLTSIEPVHAAISVGVGIEDAFATFVDRFGSWWPRSSSWSGEALQSMTLEPRPGGLLSEHGPHGFRLDWGRIVAWEPPHRLAFTWQVAPDRTPEPNPSRASEVELRFRAANGGTRVELEHRGFERHGAGAEAYRDGMASDDGWPRLLAAYAAAVQRRTEAPWEGLTT